MIFFTTYNCNANETKYININMSSEPGTLDWNLATDSSSFLIINNIMAGLTKLNNKLELENNLAEDWYFVEGENQIIFEIKISN